MDEKALHRIVAAWPGVSSAVKWGDDLVYAVGARCSACCACGGSNRGKLSFKVEPDRFLEFADRPGFRPAPYLARAHWVTLDAPGVVRRAELASLLRRAYELVRARLPKTMQRELAE